MAKLKSLLPQKEVTVAEIHEEFDTASEVFLQQIKTILSETNETDVDYANELKKLGFRRSGNVKKYESLIESTKEAEQAKAYVEHYATRYSGKFITDKMVEIICKKYGLVLGDVSDFTGEIPAKNAKQIIEFAKNFRYKDLRRIGMRDRMSNVGMMASSAYIYPSYGTSSAMWEYDPTTAMDMARREMMRRQEMEYRQMAEAAGYEMKEKRPDPEYADPRFMVVGTLDQFDMTGKKVNSEYKIVSDNPDPVVLAEVNGGYIIVSKWGAEADIKELHNEKEN